MTIETPPGRDAAAGPAEGSGPAEHDFAQPISNGPNARPRDETIAQTERGLPDDTGRPVEISPEEERRIARKILEP